VTVTAAESAPDTAARAICTACDSDRLVIHLRVGSDLGRQGLIPTTDAYGTALDDIVRCVRCGHMQLAHMPSDADLLSLYEEAESDDYVQEEAGQRQTARQTLELIERHVRRGRLLDLGCWVGYLLSEARSRGWEVCGVEPSAFASAYARERLELPVIQADLFTAELPEGHFDAVVLGDVIEHLPDPAAALDRIARLLAPGGVLYMALPDAGSTVARWMGKRWWSVIPTHVQHFTRASMDRLLRRSGYTPLEAVTAPKTFSVRYYLWRIGGYSAGLSHGLVRVAETAGFADRLWAPDFRDRMGVIARAPDRVSQR
jgi:SAM-dependent methyltransferase